MVEVLGKVGVIESVDCLAAQTMNAHRRHNMLFDCDTIINCCVCDVRSRHDRRGLCYPSANPLEIRSRHDRRVTYYALWRDQRGRTRLWCMVRWCRMPWVIHIPLLPQERPCDGPMIWWRAWGPIIFEEQFSLRSALWLWLCLQLCVDVLSDWLMSLTDFDVCGMEGDGDASS